MVLTPQPACGGKTQHCQFKPNRLAVEEALRFVGFDDVEYLEPMAQGLEDRYYKRTRGVFIGRKTPRADKLRLSKSA